MSQSGASGDTRSGKLYAAGIAVLAALASTGASYVATWNVEAQKVRYEQARELEKDFQEDFTKVLVGLRSVYGDGHNIDESARRQLLGDILFIHAKYHPEGSGRWPEHQKEGAKRIAAALAVFRDGIAAAEEAADLESARLNLYAVFGEKDKVFEQMRRESELDILKFIPAADR